jgi:hypothetical protein
MSNKKGTIQRNWQHRRRKEQSRETGNIDEERNNPEKLAT